MQEDVLPGSSQCLRLKANNNKLTTSLSLSLPSLIFFFPVWRIACVQQHNFLYLRDDSSSEKLLHMRLPFVTLLLLRLTSSSDTHLCSSGANGSLHLPKKKACGCCCCCHLGFSFVYIYKMPLWKNLRKVSFQPYVWNCGPVSEGEPLQFQDT